MAALELAASATGGPLSVVSTDGDGWRLQPALAVQAGLSAALAAAVGLREGPGGIGGAHGLLALFGSGSAARRAAEPAVHRV
ncbi:MAG TPA: hypothetical protein VIK95_15805, partial [Egibacteraceae bacterium]